MSTEDLSREVLERLDTLIVLAVCQLLTTREAKDLVSPLARAGVPPKTIAQLLGVNPTTIRTALHRARKRTNQRRTRPRGKRS